jgi:hypothetical protein
VFGCAFAIVNVIVIVIVFVVVIVIDIDIDIVVVMVIDIVMYQLHADHGNPMCSVFVCSWLSDV